jgi:uncharacterized protein (TIGR02118 family)
MQNINNKKTAIAPITRRDMLKATGQGVTLAALASAMGCASTGISASESVVGSGCLTILYVNGDDVTFDYDYYRDHHLTLIMDLYGEDAISRFELRKPVVADGEPAPAYVAAVNIWIRDAEDFAAAGAQHGATLQADVENFTNTSLVVENDIVWGESGDDLHSTEMGQRCLTILYPYEEGASWDADYYRDNHMTLIMDLYGTEAIRRFEVRKPGPLPAGNAPFLGTVNIYIENQAAFDAAGAEHTQALVADVPNFSGVFPVVVTTEIYGLNT